MHIDIGRCISNVRRKAVEHLNVLKRVGSFLIRFNKLTIFNTFILFNINVWPLSWHFCTEKNKKKIEKIQEHKDS